MTSSGNRSAIVNFHRNARRESAEAQDIAVEVQLEQDIAMVHHATDVYLGDPSDQQRQNLLSALESLDQQTAASDAYEASVIDSAVYGFSAKGSVIGKTSQNPVTEQLPASVLRAQIALVKAAKSAVTDANPVTLDALRAANTELASMRSPEESNQSSEGT